MEGLEQLNIPNNFINNNITLLICGPLHPCGIENISYYLSTSVKVIYSTWKPSNQSEETLLSTVRSLLPPENIVISDYMDISTMNISTIDNSRNIYYQAWTWAQAVKICKTEYCVKMRSNCKYDNINPLIQAIHNHTDKVICVSAFFRPCIDHSYIYIYCPSDFVISMKTKDALGVTK